MVTVVVSQPMYFPWCGLFEQIRLADVFVHYEDVQFPLGRSFTSRVQIKAPTGSQWLSVPVRRVAGQRIREVATDMEQDWRRVHRRTLEMNYRKAPFLADMLELAERAWEEGGEFLTRIDRASVERGAAYFGLSPAFVSSEGMAPELTSSERLVAIVKQLNGSRYVTGHGARNYLDHELFEREGIRVEYMNYERRPYPQLHGDFDPHVSVLDLVANVGREGKRYICSGTTYWKDFIHG